MRITIIATLALGLALVACGKDKGTSANKDDPHAGHGRPAMLGDSHAGHSHAAKGGGGPVVAVPKEGKKFEPPIQVSQVPEGAWYCDMGTVEYARMDKGDGRCPVCRMRLKQKTAEKK